MKKIIDDENIDPKKYPLMARLYEQDPGKATWSTALSTLTDPDEMRQYVREYGEWCEERRGDGKGMEVAKSNVGYATGYFDRKTAKRWFAAIEDISHPLFGRTEPAPDEAFQAGIKLGKKLRERDSVRD